MVSISLQDPVVQSYMVYSAILAIKMFAVTFLTAKVRTSKKVFANEEDAKNYNGQVKLNDPDVERVRRAHLNDLENIPAFWVLGALYLTTGPSAFLATMLFRLFTAGRIAHTVFYAIFQSPARGLGFASAFLINIYMGLQVILYYISAL
ncbi:prostaglandin E synthase-like [Trichoplusia ni]|uniref:Microsomal glutathione S-transferase 1 n=1 Tax=Trichoplusia ni TaxID=7111 RepID=A0A7E5VGD1_TRINI|nr:prostaglandin E synthase-like [Trichoplusia ni]